MTNNNSTADAVGVVEAYMQALQIKDTDTILRLYADEAERGIAEVSLEAANS
ncbi:hypothetical protein [Streptomyces sp. SA15]|uniref:hypothetical protein n=1 Tax=Streptomyces sp. SA15 TaxID=934019 RepID=UPI0015CCA1FB|nr:hypothetical protein [Streptomyces sp. SA15]